VVDIAWLIFLSHLVFKDDGASGSE